MTNEELDEARVDEAYRQAKECPGQGQNFALIAARLAREGWTPPVAVDPDIAEAETIWFEGKSPVDLVLAGIKRGRALAAAEAKPGMVWVKHDGSTICPVDRDTWVLTKTFGYNPCVNRGKRVAWQSVSFYAEITPPEDK